MNSFPRSSPMTIWQMLSHPHKDIGAFEISTSTADLKPLTHSRQNRIQGLQIVSGTRIISLVVPMTFRSSCTVARQWSTNFGKWALAWLRNAPWSNELLHGRRSRITFGFFVRSATDAFIFGPRQIAPGCTDGGDGGGLLSFSGR